MAVLILGLAVFVLGLAVVDLGGAVVMLCDRGLVVVGLVVGTMVGIGIVAAMRFDGIDRAHGGCSLLSFG